jgi:hypothetical protein
VNSATIANAAPASGVSVAWVTLTGASFVSGATDVTVTTSGGTSGVATFTVTGATVAVSPATASLTVGETQPF